MRRPLSCLVDERCRGRGERGRTVRGREGGRRWECVDGRRERDLRVLDRGRRDGEVGGCGIATGGVETVLRSGASGSIGLAFGAGGSIGVGGVGVGDGVGRVGPVVGKFW